MKSIWWKSSNEHKEFSLITTLKALYNLSSHCWVMAPKDPQKKIWKLWILQVPRHTSVFNCQVQKGLEIAVILLTRLRKTLLRKFCNFLLLINFNVENAVLPLEPCKWPSERPTTVLWRATLSHNAQEQWCENVAVKSSHSSRRNLSLSTIKMLQHTYVWVRLESNLIPITTLFDVQKRTICSAII